MVEARWDDLSPISIQSTQNGIKKQKAKQTNRKHPANGKKKTVGKRVKAYSNSKHRSLLYKRAKKKSI